MWYHPTFYVSPDGVYAFVQEVERIATPDGRNLLLPRRGGSPFVGIAFRTEDEAREYMRGEAQKCVEHLTAWLG